MKKIIYIVLTIFIFNCEDGNKVNYFDCYGIENGNDLSCFGCLEENAINYNASATQNDNSCIWSYDITQNQSFYFIKNIFDSTGNQILINNYYIGIFNNNICVGNREWNGEFTDIPAMGNSGSIINYLNIGDIPTFRLYDNIEKKEYELSFDGNCYDSGSHLNIINCGFVNNGIYYISSLNLIY